MVTEGFRNKNICLACECADFAGILQGEPVPEAITIEHVWRWATLGLPDVGPYGELFIRLAKPLVNILNDPSHCAQTRAEILKANENL